MHLRPGYLVAIGRAVGYYARAAHTFREGIKCRHCTLQMTQLPLCQTGLIRQNICYMTIGIGGVVGFSREFFKKLL